VRSSGTPKGCRASGPAIAAPSPGWSGRVNGRRRRVRRTARSAPLTRPRNPGTCPARTGDDPGPRDSGASHAVKIASYHPHLSTGTTLPNLESKGTLTLVESLLKMQDWDSLRKLAARRLLEITSGHFLDLSSDVPDLDDLRDVTFRCIARRQWESFDAVIQLAVAERAYAATALLRPMCEDLIFASWLMKVDRDLVNEYITLKMATEVLKGVREQERFFPVARAKFGREGPPLNKDRIAHIDVMLAEELSKLKALVKRHGMSKRATPTVREMATTAGITPIYDFFYHATSASAHSSLHHMFRMVWRKSGNNTAISSGNFERYHRDFALTYSVWLFSEHVALLKEVFPESFVSLEKEYNFWHSLIIIPAADSGRPPIVTRDELHWGTRIDDLKQQS